MSLHPVLAEKLSAALEPAAAPTLTPRDARLPAVSGKVHAVIGMRRAGKTTFLRTLVDSLDDSVTMIVVGAIGMFPVLPWLKEKLGSSAPVNLLKLVCALSLFVVCIASLANRSYNPFIYFRF